MKHVFISYSRKDYDDFVKNFIAELQDAKIPVWIDQKGLPPGTPDWEQTIRDAIRDAEAVLLVASVNSRKSEVVRDELEVARMEQIPIYPVWAKGEDGRYADCIPLGYSYRQRVDMREGHYDDGLSILFKALRREDYHPVLDRVKRAAEEWDAAGRPDYLLWVWEQQEPVYKVIDQLKPDLDETTQAFLVPDYERLLEQFINAPRYRQQTIIERWEEIGESCLEVMINALLYVEYDLSFYIPTFDWYQIEVMEHNKAFYDLLDILKAYPHQVATRVIFYLEHEDMKIRHLAVQVLEDLKDQRSVKPLIELLKDEDIYVRSYVAEVLGVLGSKRAVEPLIAALQGVYGNIRLEAAIALGNIGDNKAIEPLSAALKDLDINVRRGSVIALGLFGAKKVTNLLIDRLQDEDEYVRRYAICSLGQLGDARAVEPLIRLLSDKEAFVRSSAVKSLGQIGETDTLESVALLLRDKSTMVRKNVIIALGLLRDERAIKYLLESITNDYDREVFSNFNGQLIEVKHFMYAASAIEQIGTPEALTVLDRWRQDHPALYQEWHDWKSKNKQE